MSSAAARAPSPRRIAGPADCALFASDDAQRRLVENGLDTLDALFERRRSPHYCRRNGRSVAQAQLAGESGPEPIYIKLHWGRRRLWPRMNDLRSGQALQSLPAREWQGIERLERLGVRVPERLGLLESRRWSLWFRAAVVIRAVPAPRSLDEVIADGSWNELPPGDRAAILDESVAILTRIDAAGLGWRGASTRHYFPQRQADGAWALWLIDCEGVHTRPSRKALRRACEKLWRSFRESGAGADTLDELRRRFPA